MYVAVNLMTICHELMSAAKEHLTSIPVRLHVVSSNNLSLCSEPIIHTYVAKGLIALPKY